MKALKKRENKKKSSKKKWMKVGVSLFLSFFVLFLFLFYGPWAGFRNFWITSAMTTMNHRYLATWFYSDKTIQKVLSANHIIEINGAPCALIDLQKINLILHM